MNEKNKWVLLIDDDIDMLQAMGEVVQGEGYEAIGISQLKASAEKVDAQKFDCIVVDLKMGLDNGAKLIRYIRSKPSKLNFNTPVVVCSGTLGANVLLELKPMISYAVAKPIDGKTLVEKIRLSIESAKDLDYTKVKLPKRPDLLIVDDDKDFLDGLLAAFKIEPWDTFSSTSFVDAGNKLERQRFDCIIFDRHLQNRKVEGILSRMEKNEYHMNHKTPVIMISGELDKEFVESYKGRVRYFFQKPFEIHKLVESIEKIVSK